MPSVTLIFPDADLVRRAEGLARSLSVPLGNGKPVPLTAEQRAEVFALAEAKGKGAANRRARELQQPPRAKNVSRMSVLVEAVRLGLPLYEAQVLGPKGEAPVAFKKAVRR